MLESVGAVGYVIRKLNQVRENVPSSQSHFEAIEIIEAVILALVAVATAWSGYQAAKWAGTRCHFCRQRLKEKPPAAFDGGTVREGSQIENRYAFWQQSIHSVGG